MTSKLLPRHVAIVMDGNGRWARKRALPRFAGHESGARSVERAIEVSVKQNIEVLTLFAFGIENWRRPQEEVSFLMKLLLKTLEQQTAQLIKNNIQLRVIGDTQGLSPKLLEQIQQSQRLTEKCTGLKLVIALNYSGRWDLLQAVKKLGMQNVDFGALQYTDLQQHLCLADLPEPDLLIRTSGEQRLSNFMLWQFAYTELYFTEVLWPDFDEKCFQQALDFYGTRQRRYGLTGEQLAKNLEAVS